MKTKYLKITTAMLAALSISACGGGGGPVAKAPPVEVPATFAGKMGSANELVDAMIFGDSKMWSELAVSGSANYAGFMVLPDPSDDGHLYGELDMNVDFATMDVAGSADNFSNSLDEVWSGNLTIDGDLRQNVHTTGTLTSETGVDTIYSAETHGEKINAVFWAGNPDQPSIPKYIIGSMTGTMETDGYVENISPGDGAEFGVEITD